MSVKVEELTDDEVAMLLSALVELKRVVREDADMRENADKLILKLQDKKCYVRR